jgi:hypothetical protein
MKIFSLINLAAQMVGPRFRTVWISPHSRSVLFQNSKASLKVGFGLSSPRKVVNVPNEEKTFIDREGNLGTSATGES